jgi:hypothetical protein
MKRSETFTFRIAKDTKDALGKEAEYYGCTAGQLTALLAETYVQARKHFGDRLIYPPRFELIPDAAFNMFSDVVKNTPWIKEQVEEAFRTQLEEVPGLMETTKEIISGMEDPVQKEAATRKLEKLMSNKKATAAKKPNKDKG